MDMTKLRIVPHWPTERHPHCSTQPRCAQTGACRKAISTADTHGNIEKIYKMLNGIIHENGPNFQLVASFFGTVMFTKLSCSLNSNFDPLPLIFRDKNDGIKRDI
jgi:hypothetical protein